MSYVRPATMSQQQFRVYNAEDTLKAGRTFSRRSAAALWVNEFRDTDWWPHNVLHVEVHRGDITKRAQANGGYDAKQQIGVITFQTGTQITDHTLVHELAHVIASALHQSTSHDPWWARTHIELTYLMLGPAAYGRLRVAYQTYGVDFDADGVIRRNG